MLFNRLIEKVAKCGQEGKIHSLNYRSDIDGLRAIAVLSVIFFHINDKIITGGFVGVDIFFVISGYLISLQIFRDLEEKRFSILEFYRRRVKRIAPSLLIVMSFTIVVTQLFFRPEDAERAAESGLWSLLSIPNVYFWLFQDTSYFAASSSELPLLHLWSLGVEEQFYMFWPLILLLFYKKSNEYLFLFMTVLAAIISFWFGEIYFLKDNAFVYYMLPARGGELLLGAISAQIVNRNYSIIFPDYVAIFLAYTGLVLMIGSLFLLSEDVVFPGYYAIPPTLGTAMVILAGHYGKSVPTRLLSNRFLVQVGLISYSAYLWHWPLLSFLRYGQFDIGFKLGMTILMLTFFLAWVTTRYVEYPIRISRKSAFQVFWRYYIFPASIIGFCSIGFMKIDGYGLRWISGDYKENLALIKESVRPPYKYDEVCQKQKIRIEDMRDTKCIIGKGGYSHPKILLWGDSNAAQYIGMLDVFSHKQGFVFRNIEIGSCPPLYGKITVSVEAKRLTDCISGNEIIWNSLDEFDVVILGASWTSYQENSGSFLDKVFNTVNMIVDNGKKVILLGKIPVFPTYNRTCREKKISLPFINCEIPDIPLDKDIAEINERLLEFSLSSENIDYFEVTKYLCPEGVCSLYNNNGNPIYFDTSHLSHTASIQLGTDIINNEGVPFPFSNIGGITNSIVAQKKSELFKHDTIPTLQIRKK